MIKIFTELKIPETDYFLTGSRALDDIPTENIKWNGNSKYTKISYPESDYDYVILIFYRDRILNYLISNGYTIEYSCYNGGFKFIYNNKLYNIITTVPIEFMSWREALIILKNLICIDEKYKVALLNKSSRYAVYEQFRGLLKTIIRLGQLEPIIHTDYKWED